MLNDQDASYINLLLDTNGEGLDDEALSLFERLRAAKAEGDEAAAGARRLRNEATRLDVMVTNRQGRFDAIADLLIAKRDTDGEPIED